ncbi:MAG: GNAT family N-acetyltransferase [Elusimicrobia bacterium]|nr:GNAT family N-acetyltransferase [Elusimicrobiota bacterium]
MKERFAIATAAGTPAVALRAIAEEDLEDLRLWKNANRAGFFFQEVISREMQTKWFEGYLERPHDRMFLVESGPLRAGCMGFRMLAGAADCYNIIAAPQARGKGLLGGAMRLLCSYIAAEHTARIGCRVLKGNPAVDWYRKCGYRIAGEREDHFEMELDLDRFKSCAYEKT